MTAIDDHASGALPTDPAELIASADHYNTPLGPDGTPYHFFTALRDAGEKLPMAWSEPYGGAWAVLGYHEVVEIMQKADAFSNKGVTFPRYNTGDFELMLAGQDDPVHKNYRKLVAAPFSPAKTAEFSEALAKTTHDLIDEHIESGRGDLASWIANEVPARLTAIILGLDPLQGELYRGWMYSITHDFVTAPQKAAATFGEMVAHARELIEERRRHPGTDIMSLVVNAEVDGDRLSDDDLIGFFTVLLIGGIDNTARFLTTSLWRLANDPPLRRHLIANPDKIPVAVDELLRYYTPALIGRLAVRDVQVNDVTIKAGQQVMLWLPVANRDRRVFPDADTFIADRTPNRHLGLGNGIHRCLGAHLIRVEGHVTFREFLKRIPDFEIDPDKPITWQAGQVSGVSELNVVFEPGTRLG